MSDINEIEGMGGQYGDLAALERAVRRLEVGIAKFRKLQPHKILVKGNEDKAKEFLNEWTRLDEHQALVLKAWNNSTGGCIDATEETPKHEPCQKIKKRLELAVQNISKYRKRIAYPVVKANKEIKNATAGQLDLNKLALGMKEPGFMDKVAEKFGQSFVGQGAGWVAKVTTLSSEEKKEFGKRWMKSKGLTDSLAQGIKYKFTTREGWARTMFSALSIWDAVLFTRWHRAGWNAAAAAGHVAGGTSRIMTLASGAQRTTMAGVHQKLKKAYRHACKEAMSRGGKQLTKEMIEKGAKEFADKTIKELGKKGGAKLAEKTAQKVVEKQLLKAGQQAGLKFGLGMVGRALIKYLGPIGWAIEVILIIKDLCEAFDDFSDCVDNVVNGMDFAGQDFDSAEKRREKWSKKQQLENVDVRTFKDWATWDDQRKCDWCRGKGSFGAYQKEKGLKRWQKPPIKNTMGELIEAPGPTCYEVAWQTCGVDKAKAQRLEAIAMKRDTAEMQKMVTADVIDGKISMSSFDSEDAKSAHSHGSYPYPDWFPKVVRSFGSRHVTSNDLIYIDFLPFNRNIDKEKIAKLSRELKKAIPSGTKVSYDFGTINGKKIGRVSIGTLKWNTGWRSMPRSLSKTKPDVERGVLDMYFEFDGDDDILENKSRLSLYQTIVPAIIKRLQSRSQVPVLKSIQRFFHERNHAQMGSDPAGEFKWIQGRADTPAERAAWAGKHPSEWGKEVYQGIDSIKASKVFVGESLDRSNLIKESPGAQTMKINNLEQDIIKIINEEIDEALLDSQPALLSENIAALLSNMAKGANRVQRLGSIGKTIKAGTGAWTAVVKAIKTTENGMTVLRSQLAAVDDAAKAVEAAVKTGNPKAIGDASSELNNALNALVRGAKKANPEIQLPADKLAAVRASVTQGMKTARHASNNARKWRQAVWGEKAAPLIRGVGSGTQGAGKAANVADDVARQIGGVTLNAGGDIVLVVGKNNTVAQRGAVAVGKGAKAKDITAAGKNLKQVGQKLKPPKDPSKPIPPAPMPNNPGWWYSWIPGIGWKWLWVGLGVATVAGVGYAICWLKEPFGQCGDDEGGVKPQPKPKPGGRTEVKDRCVDGKCGKATSGAIKEFQKSVGIKPTGYIDGDTAKKMSMDLYRAANPTKAAGLKAVEEAVLNKIENLLLEDVGGDDLFGAAAKKPKDDNAEAEMDKEMGDNPMGGAAEAEKPSTAIDKNPTGCKWVRFDMGTWAPADKNNAKKIGAKGIQLILWNKGGKIRTALCAFGGGGGGGGGVKPKEKEKEEKKIEKEKEPAKPTDPNRKVAEGAKYGAECAKKNLKPKLVLDILIKPEDGESWRASLAAIASKKQQMEQEAINKIIDADPDWKKALEGKPYEIQRFYLYSDGGNDEVGGKQWNNGGISREDVVAAIGTVAVPTKDGIKANFPGWGDIDDLESKLTDLNKSLYSTSQAIGDAKRVQQPNKAASGREVSQAYSVVAELRNPITGNMIRRQKSFFYRSRLQQLYQMRPAARGQAVDTAIIMAMLQDGTVGLERSKDTSGGGAWFNIRNRDGQQKIVDEVNKAFGPDPQAVYRTVDLELSKVQLTPESAGIGGRLSQNGYLQSLIQSLRDKQNCLESQIPAFVKGKAPDQAAQGAEAPAAAGGAPSGGGRGAANVVTQGPEGEDLTQQGDHMAPRTPEQGGQEPAPMSAEQKAKRHAVYRKVFRKSGFSDEEINPIISNIEKRGYGTNVVKDEFKKARARQRKGQ